MPRSPEENMPPAGSPDRIEHITKLLLDFRRARGWKTYHKPKDMALSLVLEASELLEHFQWKTDRQAKAYIAKNKEAVADELADVFNWVLLLSHDLKVDIARAAEKKISKNGRKYPVGKIKLKF